MFKRIVNTVEVLALAGACVAVILLFAAEPDDRSSANATTGAAASGDAYLSETGALPTNAREIYTAQCARCHGNNGQGGIGPQLAGRVADRFPDVEDEVMVVARGRGSMPAFSTTLTDAEIREVVAYTRTALGR